MAVLQLVFVTSVTKVALGGRLDLQRTEFNKTAVWTAVLKCVRFWEVLLFEPKCYLVCLSYLAITILLLKYSTHIIFVQRQHHNHHTRTHQ